MTEGPGKRLKLDETEQLREKATELKGWLVEDTLRVLETENNCNHKKLTIILHCDLPSLTTYSTQLQSHLPTTLLVIPYERAIDLRMYYNWTELKITEKVLLMTLKTFAMTLYHGFLKLNEISLILKDHPTTNEVYSLQNVLSDFPLTSDQLSHTSIISISSLEGNLSPFSSTSNGRDNTVIKVFELVEYTPDLLDLATDPLQAFKTILFTRPEFKEEKLIIQNVYHNLGVWARDMYTMSLVAQVTKPPTCFPSATNSTLDDNEGTFSHSRELSDAWIQHETTIHKILNITITPNNGVISNKVQTLYKTIDKQLAQANSSRIIIYARDSQTVHLLHLILKKLYPERANQISYIFKKKPRAFDNNTNIDDTLFHKRLSDFRKGRINIIVACFDSFGSIGCNFYHIVWFDFFPSLVNLINSGYFQLEEGVSCRILCDTTDPDDTNVGAILLKMKDFPPSLTKLVTPIVIHPSRLKTSDPQSYIFEVKETGARVTLNYSKSLINQYCQSLSSNGVCGLTATYQVISEPPNFRCVMELPESSPIEAICGGAFTTKQEAKHHVAWLGCTKLFKRNALDLHLIPLVDKSFNILSNPIPNTNDRNNLHACLPVTTKIPDQWLIPNQPYPKYLFLNYVLPSSTQIHPFAIATRSIFPDLIPIQMKFNGTFVQLKIYPASSPIRVSKTLLSLMVDFTTNIFGFVLKKSIFCPLENFPYYIVPLSSIISGGTIDINQIDTNALAYNPDTIPIIENWTNKMAHMRGSKHLFRVIEDRVADGSSTNDELKLLLLNHSIDFIGLDQSYQSENSDTDRCILDTKSNYQVIDLEVDVINAALILPSLMKRVGSLLLAKEVQNRLNLTMIKDELLVEALTLQSAHLPLDLKRCEFLGDSFLNFIIRTFSIVASFEVPGRKHEKFNAFFISNKLLFTRCTELEIHYHLCIKKFTESTWLPVHFLDLKNSRVYEPDSQLIPKKWLADVIESILGAAILSGGEIAGLQCMSAIGIWPSNVPPWDTLEHITRNKRFDLSQGLQTTLRLAQLESAIGYQFKNSSVLLATIIYNDLLGGTNDQPWAQLGHEVERYFFTKWAVKKYPYMTAFFFHRLRSSAENLDTLACFEKDLLLKLVTQVITKLQNNSNEVSLEISSAVSKLFPASGLSVFRAKNINQLSKGFMSTLLGAIFFDSGLYFSTVSQYIDRFLVPSYSEMAQNFSIQFIQPLRFIKVALYINQCTGLTISTRQILNPAALPSFTTSLSLHATPIVTHTGPALDPAETIVTQQFLHLLNQSPDLIRLHCRCPRSTITFKPLMSPDIVLLD